MLVDLREHQASEADVARLVFGDVRMCTGNERMRGMVADEGERRQPEPLDEHLHPETGNVPPRIVEDIVEQLGERRRGRIADADLLVEQPAEDLDVARLVDHLRGAEEASRTPRRLLHDSARGEERSLLSSEKLPQLPPLMVL